jgi:ribonuclease PH
MTHTTEPVIDGDDMFDNIEDTDYIFVVGEDGTLKSILLPDEFESQTTPENVEKILSIFQVSNFHSATIH